MGWAILSGAGTRPQRDMTRAGWLQAQPGPLVSRRRPVTSASITREPSALADTRALAGDAKAAARAVAAAMTKKARSVAASAVMNRREPLSANERWRIVSRSRPAG